MNGFCDRHLNYAVKGKTNSAELMETILLTYRLYPLCGGVHQGGVLGPLSLFIGHLLRIGSIMLLVFLEVTCL